jgi:predicted metal-dependent RNase
MNYKNGLFCRNPKNGVIFTCYQVDGTDGARILYAEQNKEEKKDKITHDKKWLEA